MSTPFGVDFGNYSSVIGVAKNRGIDVVVNEVSNRSTPSLVGFGQKSRFLGEGAKSNEISNLKNTVGSLKRILGSKYDSPVVAEEQKFVSSQLADINGDAGVKVRFQGQEQVFNSIQLAAMYLNKLKNTTLSELKSPISDVVITVPVWYTDPQRRAMATAAVVAGLNPVRIMNETTAAAVSYGVFKTDLPEDEPRKVAIVDFGHSSYTVAICAFKKGEAKVLGTSYDKHFGGRDIDYMITEHFAKVFQEKYKIDIKSNPKAYSRVLTQAEKMKKILSANSSAHINVESVMNDIDASGSMTRQELEEYMQPFLEKLHLPIERALKAADMTAGDLDHVEVIGGNSRVPIIKEKIGELFGKPLSFTLNQDESIARGAAFVCAIHSPTVRVRPFKFEDYNTHSVTFSWAKVPEEDLSELEVFPAGGIYPSTKVITLYRKEDFELEARYTNPEFLEPGTSPVIGKWTVRGVKPADNGEAIAVKIKLRQDPSGIFTVESAYSAEEVTVEEAAEGDEAAKEGEEAAAATEGAENAEDKKTKTTTKWQKKDSLTIVHSSDYDEATIAKLLELESQMASDDKLVADTEDRKNALEEYIYEIRGKIDDQYAEFANDAEKQKIRDLADASEEWLYGDGEEATKAQYIAKYEELASVGNLVRGRYLSKIEEEKQAKQAAAEAEKQRFMAEKLQADRAAREAADKQKQEQQPAQEDTELPDAPSA